MNRNCKYWQVEMDTKYCDKTAFSLEPELFELQCLLFGQIITAREKRAKNSFLLSLRREYTQFSLTVWLSFHKRHRPTSNLFNKYWFYGMMLQSRLTCRFGPVHEPYELIGKVDSTGMTRVLSDTVDMIRDLCSPTTPRNYNGAPDCLMASQDSSQVLQRSGHP